MICLIRSVVALLFASLLLHPSHQFLANGQVCYADGTCQGPANDDEETAFRKAAQALIDDLHEDGGFFHPSLEIRRYLRDNDDSDFKIGLFVREDAKPLSEGEKLFYIPHDHMLQSLRTNNIEYNVCLQAKKIARERNLHKRGQSEYGTYMDFLEKYVVGKAKIPGTWSDTAKSYLQSIVQIEGFTNLSQFYQCFQVEADEEDRSDDEEDNMSDPKYWDENIELARSLGWETVMIPIYELVQHSNHPDKINVIDSRSLTSIRSFNVETSRDIKPGEQLFHSMDGGDKKVGTTDIFRDCGFVEDYPRMWYFQQNDIAFIIKEEETEEGAEQLYSIEWIGDFPDDDGVYFLQQNMDFFIDVQQEMFEMATEVRSTGTDLDKMSVHEIKMIHQYLDAMIKAMGVAVNAIDTVEEESKYLVQEERYVINHLDDEFHRIYQCMSLVAEYNDDAFNDLEIMKSAYQKIEFLQDPETEDICFYLDNVFQMCWSYWPHYHEPAVHKLAKYISDPIKRVLWVGGGDSGLLNEILKYPSLELVVGLELDQQVTRLSFKHFAARPHYENPKVQWWYGDASKTMLMLPREYFGSFDMVLVDLSDTLFSLTVSAELDVIEALSLLLKPGGVFEMNEPFFKRVSDVFEYTIHYTYQDVPRVCDQSYIIASNDLNFLYQKLTEHKLDENATVHVENASLKTLSQFDKVHDFRRNPNSAYKRLCKKDGTSEQGEEKEQEVSPGIVIIVEAENLSLDLESPEKVRSAIMSAIEEEGMTILSKDESSETSQFTIVFKEGYLVARTSPKFKYVSLDIHLWSAFDKHESLKEAVVVKALGGNLKDQSTTSYRIVAGGMFGLPTWKGDAEMKGPKVSRVCDTSSTTRDAESDLGVFTFALETAFDIVEANGLVVAVLCDVETEPCHSLQVLENHATVGKIIPIRPCSPSSDEKTQFSCMMDKVEDDLEAALPEEDDLIDAIVLDWNSPMDLRETIDAMIVDQVLDIGHLFVVGTIDSKDELWKRRLIDNFRHSLVVMDPVFRAHVLFNTTNSSLEMAVAAAGDPYFIEHLTKAVAESDKKREDVTIEIRNIFGGKWRPERKNTWEMGEASQFMIEEDYDNSAALVQWRSQYPLATQAISQFTHMSSLETGERVKVKQEDPDSGSPVLHDGSVFFVNGNVSYDVELDSDEIVENIPREDIQRVGGDLPELVDREQFLEACRYAFSMRTRADAHVYDEEIGGDGIVCTGIWGTGTGVILWDGRHQVDINSWSVQDMDEIDNFENSFLEKLPNLVQKLRDVQPRGHGRVVNFKDDVFRGKRKP